VAGLDDSLYSGQFSELAREINAIAIAGQARDLEAATSHVLDVASGLAQSLPGSFAANVEDIPFSSDSAMRDINAARVRLAAALATIDGVGDGGAVPPQLAGEVKAALVNGWAEAYAVAGEADALPSLATELSKVTQNLRESRTVLPEVLAPVAETIADIVNRILKALTSKLWPWVLVAGLVFLIVEFAPELRLLVAGVIKSKTPGGA
jgi:hypothetical protein